MSAERKIMLKNLRGESECKLIVNIFKSIAKQVPAGADHKT